MPTQNPIESEHSFLKSLPPDYREILISCAQKREFSAGEIIFREGEIADRLYLIESGRILLESHASPEGCLSFQELSGEDVLGWSWLFPPYVWHFQARALELTKTIAFNGAHLLIACERNHEFGYDLMKRLSQVLIQRLQTARLQLVRLHGTRAPINSLQAGIK